MALGPYLSGLALTIGVFLLFPVGVKRSFTLLIPAAYFLGKIIWIYSTDNNDDFKSVPTWSYFAVGAVISITVFLLSNWLCYRRFHGEDRHEARLKGLEQIADDLPADKWKAMMLTVLRERREFKRSF
jgi:hypothetical protein